MIELFCPKLKSLADEYTQKKMSQISGQHRETVGIKNHTDNRQQNQTTDKLFVPETSGPFLNQDNKFLEPILMKCDVISRLSKQDRVDINSYQFVQKAVKESGHPKAIDEALDMLINRWTEVKQPWPYMMAIFKMKNGNYWEDEHIAECKKFKDAWVADDKVQGLISQIG